MDRIRNTLFGLMASLKPKSNQLEIQTYGKNSLSDEQTQALIKWLMEGFMEANYCGRGYLIFDVGNQDIQGYTLMAVLREEPMFLYRLGTTPSQTQAGVKWELTQHPSMRLYQLVSDVSED